MSHKCFQLSVQYTFLKNATLTVGYMRYTKHAHADKAAGILNFRMKSSMVAFPRNGKKNVLKHRGFVSVETSRSQKRLETY